ncbi:hypothetical protein [Streptomyces sp. NPDC001601]
MLKAALPTVVLWALWMTPASWLAAMDGRVTAEPTWVKADPSVE